MPMKNSLNVSELLKRLGVVGDSQGSAELLDQLRMGVTVADLSDLVPPVGVPVGGAHLLQPGTVGDVNSWNLQCRSPGGLRVTGLAVDKTAEDFLVWISDVQPFAGPVTATAATADFSFGQATQSLYRMYTTVPPVVPAASLMLADTREHIGRMIPPENWVGPGQFFNIESVQNDRPQDLTITWVEYPGMVNP